MVPASVKYPRSEWSLPYTRNFPFFSPTKDCVRHPRKAHALRCSKIRSGEVPELSYGTATPEKLFSPTLWNACTSTGYPACRKRPNGSCWRTASLHLTVRCRKTANGCFLYRNVKIRPHRDAPIPSRKYLRVREKPDANGLCWWAPPVSLPFSGLLFSH